MLGVHRMLQLLGHHVCLCMASRPAVPHLPPPNVSSEQVQALVDGKVLCVHGGLSPDLRTLDQVRLV